MSGRLAKTCAADPINDAVDSPPALNSVIIMVSAVTSANSPEARAVARTLEQIVLRIGGSPLEVFV